MSNLKPLNEFQTVSDAAPELLAVCKEALIFVEEMEARLDTHFLIGGKLHQAIQNATPPISRVDEYPDQ